MFKSFLLLLAVVMFGLNFASAQTHPSKSGTHGSAAKAEAQSEQNAEAAGAASLAQAKVLYQRDCALCHGATGNGQTEVAKSMSLSLSDFSDPKTLAGKSDQALFDAIRKGTDKMPPEDKSRAKDDEITGLVTYIRSLAKEKPAGAPAATPAPAAAPAAAAAASPAPGN